MSILVAVPSHCDACRRSWTLQSPLGAEGKTWQQLKQVVLVETGPYRYFLPIITTAIGDGKYVLDVGAGDCCFTCCMAEGNSNTFLAIDLVDDPFWNRNAELIINLAGFNDRVEFRPGVNAALYLPFNDKTFDVSTAIAVLEHVWCPGHHNVIENMIRVSKEKCIFMFPTLSDRWKVDPYTEGAGHINLFDEFRLKRCFGRYLYRYDVYQNKHGMPCWLVIMDLNSKHEGDVLVKWI